jgi:hypothetical protein
VPTVLFAEGKCIFQGWALVDNASADDWKAVELSLTAGQANSFVYDLYTARFVKRRSEQRFLWCLSESLMV